MQLLNIFNGTGLIPIVLIAAALYSFYRAYRSSKSNSKITDSGEDNTGNVPLTQIGSFWFGVILSAAAIGYFIIQYFEQ